MSKLEELIRKMCPDGVEYKKIKDIYKRLKGTPITAGKMKEIASPNGQIQIFAGGKTVVHVHEEDIPKANIICVPSVIVQSRGIIVLYTVINHLLLKMKCGHIHQKTLYM